MSVARLKILLARYGGVELSVFTRRRPAHAQSVPRAVHLRAHGSVAVSARGQGTRGAVARAHEELEDESPALSRGAGSRQRGHGGGGAARASAGVIRPELLYGIGGRGREHPRRVAVTSRATWSVTALDAMLSFAAGFMISVSLVDLFPDAIVVAGAAAPVGRAGGVRARAPHAAHDRPTFPLRRRDALRVASW